jgi:RHS repeat-associated protein
MTRPASSSACGRRAGNGVTLSRLTYTYDPTARRKSVTDLGGRTSWTYDNAYQLSGEQRSGSATYNVTWTYDPAGNRLLQNDTGQRTSYVYDAADQLQLANGPTGVTSYVYDGCGSRTEKITPSLSTYYTWDEDLQLIAAEPASGTVTLVYDPDKRRTQKQSGGETFAYLYDFDKVLIESDGSNDTIREFTSTDDQYGALMSEYDADSGDTLYHAYDGLGSTNGLTADNSLATDQYAYRAFGLETHTPAPPGMGAALPAPMALRLGSVGASGTDYSFVGRDGYVADRELDLYFLRRRYYDPDAGRFLSEDPIVSTAGHPFWVKSGDDLASRPFVDDLLGEEDSEISDLALGRWVQACDLRVGDVLSSRRGERCVVW